MQIGDLAKSADVTVQAIRFYERKGLLPSPPRKESGYRVYGEVDGRRLAGTRPTPSHPKDGLDLIERKAKAIERTLDSNGGNKNGTAKRRSLPLSRSGLRL
jgi:MerR-like DNA binding protein